MVKEISIDENYTTVGLFDSLKVGDIVKVPFDSSRHSGIKAEASRRHQYAKIRGEKVTSLNPIFRVSETEYQGYTTVIRMR